MIKIQKRTNISKKHDALLRLGAIAIALVVSGILILCLGFNPITMYGKMVMGAVGKPALLKLTVKKCIPLLIMSLGVSIAFKMKFWNIGAEGQFYMGAFGATWLWLTFPTLPSYILLPLMMIAAIVTGGLWALIPAVLKHKLGTSETLVTLMLNYIAIQFITYLSLGPWRDPRRGQNEIYQYLENARLPEVFGVHIGWIIALVLVVFFHILMKYTKFGYEIAVLGENAKTAKYAGMNVTKTLIIAVMISGGVCGLAGMIEATGVSHRLADNISGGLGFTAVITAWLAQLSAPLILAASFLFAVLLQGGSMLTVMGLSSATAEVIQGIILFFVLASEFFSNYKIVITKKEDN